ncbi:hypothetical protein [Acidocella aminolytica]|uniref:Uncharacterized protein n=1 Tax=Acidocella aminolytica 101 = DSM 11237 TaxID=1120923 RepID=A0A0D6PI75_9PROT|nr:hypothetical protein [Acidocella aminolytica]GAN81475.1 hypothetical protein Aam_096_034 [Acidocella aminolytica 101 = DSM 11237]
MNQKDFFNALFGAAPEDTRELIPRNVDLEFSLSLVTEVERRSPLSLAVKIILHSLWIERGHFIRSCLNDDDMLADFLWRSLPLYSGGGRELYRGEAVKRWIQGRVGFCWTDKLEIAEMFAKGYNALEPDGGVVLKTFCPKEAIISEPNNHSRWLGENEYTVDSRRCHTIEEICRYPAVKGNTV